MKIIWIESPGLEAGNGHGADIHFMKGERKSEYVAFLEGYDWHDSNPETIAIQIRNPEEFSDPSVVETVKRDVEKALREKRLWQGKISKKVFVWLNA